jgi:hypothetical protein
MAGEKSQFIEQPQVPPSPHPHWTKLQNNLVLSFLYDHHGENPQLLAFACS